MYSAEASNDLRRFRDVVLYFVIACGYYVNSRKFARIGDAMPMSWKDTVAVKLGYARCESGIGF